MAGREISTFVSREAEPSSSAETSERSTTPPLSVEQQLASLRKEICELKQQNEVSMKSLSFSWETIPAFNPGENNLSVNRWIRLIEERAYFMRWDDVTTTQFVVSKLEGRAREWYLAGEFAHKSWVQPKSALRFTFDVDTSATGLLFLDAAQYISNNNTSLLVYFEENLKKYTALIGKFRNQIRLTSLYMEYPITI